jgi:hypothetical protein
MVLSCLPSPSLPFPCNCLALSYDCCVLGFSCLVIAFAWLGLSCLICVSVCPVVYPGQLGQIALYVFVCVCVTGQKLEQSCLVHVLSIFLSYLILLLLFDSKLTREVPTFLRFCCCVCHIGAVRKCVGLTRTFLHCYTGGKTAVQMRFEELKARSVGC